MKILSEERHPRRARGRHVALSISILALAGMAAGGAWLWHRSAERARSVTSTPSERPSLHPPARPAAPSPGATSGRIEVEASAPDAVVVVDGRRLGRAPQGVELPAGAHQVRVESEGLLPFERDVHVVPGRTLRLSARLESQAPRLRIDSDVPGASVFVDRRAIGKTPLETRELAPGTHQLNVTADGYEMYSDTIEVGAGDRSVMVRFKEVRLDESLAVTHKHGIGSCRGRLQASSDGLRYQSEDPADAFQSPFSALDPLQVDYLKRNLRVKVRGGKTYNFTADSPDALLSFQKAVEAARKRL